MGLGFLLLVLLPLTELMILIKVGGLIGLLPTLAIIFTTASAGLFLMRREGFSTLGRAQQRMAAGEVPGTEMMEGLVIAFCGALLLAPGFITDSIALLGLIPQVRRAMIKRAMESGRLQSYSSGGIYGFSGTSQFHSDGFQPRDENPFQRPPSRPTSPPSDGGIIEGEFRRED